MKIHLKIKIFDVLLKTCGYFFGIRNIYSYFSFYFYNIPYLKNL